MLETPFSTALGPGLEKASPLVRRHHSLAGPQAFQGHARVRSRGFAGRLLAALLRLGSWADLFSAVSIVKVPFEVENNLLVEEGKAVMIWRRILHFPGATRRYEGHLWFEPARNVIIDSMSWLEVELIPSVEQGAVMMRSGRQWLRFGNARFPLPQRISATAETYERDGTDSNIHLGLAIRSPMLGEILRYDATFRRKEGT